MNARDLSLCFHCGTPVSPGTNWHATVSGQNRPMCCPGCAAVANSIVAAGMERFYLERDGFSARVPELSAAPEALQLYDLRAGSAAGTDASYAIEGLRCAACIWLVERTVQALPGIRQAELNFGTGTLHVTCDFTRCKPSDILAAVRSVGYTAHPADATPYSEHLKREQRGLFRRLFIAGLSMMQVMMYAVPAYLANDGTMDVDMAGLMRWAGLLLTVPAVAYSAQPFFSGAWRNLRQRVLGMDVPVALGIAAAFGASVWATLERRDPVYFDSITMFIFLLLGSRYLELHARMRAATALDKILRATPASARRLVHWPQDQGGQQASELVNAEILHPGDHVLLGAGEVLAADGVIEQGATRIDLSVLTGESRPQQRAIGDALPAGACNLTHPVVLRIVRPAEASTLALLIEAARKARLAKPALATWADTVAARFVGGLLLLTLCAFLYWQSADPARAWPVLIAMLVVSCPCALSLAAPTVLAAANARLLGQGVLAIQPHVLEVLRRATHVVFDKTGTLTSGKPVLRSIDTAGSMGRSSALALAAAIASGDSHPLGAAIHAAGRKLTDTRTATDIEYVAGSGIEACVDGMRYRLGSARFVAQLAGDSSPFAEYPDASEVYLGRETGWIARFQLNDAVRAEARAVIEHFKAQGKSVMVLSGDKENLARAVARELHIDQVIGNCLPEQKVEAVRTLRRDGAIVAMVGDGINDAAVLSAADVSFAMGEGSALAQASADCVLLSGRLDSLCEIDRVSVHAARLMKQNLVWAAAYNLAAIPAAALGLIDPWMSAVGMSASSILVVLNSLRVYHKSAAQQALAAGMRVPARAN